MLEKKKMVQIDFFFSTDDDSDNGANIPTASISSSVGVKTKTTMSFEDSSKAVDRLKEL